MSSNIPQIAITAQGRSRAAELLQQSQYAGCAPVTFEKYVEQVRKQSVQKVEVHAADVSRAFNHLVIDHEILRQFGTALNSGSAIFLYGPAGGGKTTMAEVLSRVMSADTVWIPYAVEVDGQIITVYDPSIHKQAEDPKTSTIHDERWVLCHRPAVLVGGELTVEMLDMQHNPASNYYVAPMQMKANNGVLVIDDFGRQRIRPEELLNRWTGESTFSPWRVERRLRSPSKCWSSSVPIPIRPTWSIPPSCGVFKPRSRSAQSPTRSSLRSSAAWPATSACLSTMAFPGT
jgi:predicted ATPase with chaperone activity